MRTAFIFISMVIGIWNHVVFSQNIPLSSASPWGVAAHPITDREWEHIDIFMLRVKDAGIKWIREDFKFGYICRNKSDFVFERYDSLLLLAERNDIQVLPILQAYDNELESASRTDVLPIYKHPEEWREFVRETVGRYHHKLKYWEIWNEQDGGFWKPHPDASQYVLLLKIAFEEIKRIDPDCKVIVGGLCSWNAEYLKAMYQAGAKGYFDIIAVHPYNYAPDANKQAKRMMEETLEVVEKNEDKHIPFWITEFGGTTFSGQLAEQQPGFALQAIHYALEKLNIEKTDDLKIGIIVSPRIKNIDEIERTRKWLPGIELEPIAADQLNDIHVDKFPVLIGSEGVYIDDSLLEPMLNYIKRGGLLVTANQIPFYTVYSLDDKGIWQRADRADEVHPMFRMGFDAWWRKEGLPNSTNDVRLNNDAREAGLPQVNNIYVDRYLTDTNMRDTDVYYPIIEAYHSGKHIGDGMALYTYGDWRGGLLVSTVSLITGYTEAEQANLLQRIYLVYLSLGIEKMFWYDFHSDGELKGEKEHNFGLLNWDWTPKPAYIAYQHLTKMLGEQPAFIQKIKGKNESIWALLFKRTEDDALILAAWTLNELDMLEITDENKNRRRIELKNTEVQFIPVSAYSSIQF